MSYVVGDIVFDILGLAQEERDGAYWSVCELVKNRLEKARSMYLNRRKKSRGIDLISLVGIFPSRGDFDDVNYLFFLVNVIDDPVSSDPNAVGGLV